MIIAAVFRLPPPWRRARTSPLSLRMMICFLALSGCSQLKYFPQYSRITAELKNEVTTGHFIFHLSDGDSVNAAWQEAYYTWLTAKLGLEMPDKIHYYKYEDKDQIYRLLHYNGNATARFGRVHSIWPADNHELVHVLIDQNIGNPPKLFSEGIAVAHQTNPEKKDTIPRWGAGHVDDIARQLIQGSKVPPMDSLLYVYDFIKFDPDITYPVSGSFVGYLLGKYGLDAFYEFAAESGWDDSGGEIKRKFKKVYRIELAVAWEAWLKGITG